MRVKTTVRVRPRTGLGKQKRARRGLIYLPPDWLGLNVVVITAIEYRTMMARLKYQNTCVKSLRRVCAKFKGSI